MPYPNAKLAIVDWRGPGNWTSPQRARAAALVSCSVSWTEKPITGVTTVIGVQTGLELFNGVPAGSAGQPKYDIATEATTLGYDLFPLVTAGGTVVSSRIRTFAANPPGHTGTETYALNMARGVVCRWWAAKMVASFAWADGLHVDYWTPASGWVPGDIGGGNFLNPGYTGVSGGTAFDTLYMRGLNRAIHEYRRLRTAQGKTSLVIGQQWHNGNGAVDMNELDSRFIEQDPDRWGTDPWQTYHQARFDEWSSIAVPHGGAKSKMVVENAVRAAGAFLNKPQPDPTYQAAIMTFADTNQCYVAWGREDQAGIGWPGN